MPNFSATNLPTRSIEDIRKLRENGDSQILRHEGPLTYADLNTAEITKVQSEDQDLYKALLQEVDGPPPSPETVQEPAPTPTRTIWRNGKPVEIPAAVSFINGVAQQ